MTRTTVAIDGTAGSGKSTVARLVAARLGLAHIDTGAMYRLIALQALERGVPLDAPEKLAALAAEVSEGVTLGRGGGLRWREHDVGREIRTPEVSRAASILAPHPAVRNVLVELQRRLVPPDGAVIEGRDIGTVVYPDADLKVFLDARTEVRARRRASDASEPGADASAAVHERDTRDAEREIGAMRAASDAMQIDTSDRSPEDIAELVVSRLHQVPAPPNLLYRTLWSLVRLIATGVFRLEIAGAERIPARGPAILAPNHRAFLDIPIAAILTRRKVWYMTKDDLFKVRPLGSFFTRLGGFPVRRGKPDRKSLQRALELLAQGEILGIFPEGTRTPDARFDRLEEGFAYLALKSGAPIVPVALSGTERVYPKERKLPRFPRLRARVGEPFVLGGPVAGVMPRSRIRDATAEAQHRLRAVIDEIEPR